jgi:hypothetical protein
VPFAFGGADANLLADVDGDGDDDFVAWTTGLTDGLGSIRVALSSGTGIGTAQAWMEGTSIAPVAFGGTYLRVGHVD